MSDREPNWIDLYYETAEFFHWEPQHIGRKKFADAKLNTLEKVRGHLGSIEVTLNHNLKHFFFLAPDSLRNRLFHELFGTHFDGRFVMQGAEIDRNFGLDGCMQPDFLFVSQAAVASIEMKLGSPCSLDQVLKYALLGLAVENQQGVQKEHGLLLLGSGTLAKQFPGRYGSVEELRDAVVRQDLTKFLQNKPPHLCDRRERLAEIVAQTWLAFVSYDQLAQRLTAMLPPQDDQSDGAQVYRKLTGGLIEEFKRRHLI